jgi:sugar phosphate isomerase/epimerase
MQIGISLDTHNCGKDVQTDVERAFKAGLIQAIEVREPFALIGSDARNYDAFVRRLISDYNPTVSLHLSYDVWTATQNRYLRQDIIEEIHRMLEYGMTLQASIVVAHPLLHTVERGSPYKLEKTAYMDTTVEILNGALKNTIADADVCFTLETMPYGKDNLPLIQLETMLTNLEYSNKGITVDTSHINLAGFHMDDLRKHKFPVRHVHVVGNDGTNDTHCRISQSAYSLTEDLLILKNSGYTGALIMEFKDLSLPDIVFSEATHLNKLLQFTN